LFIKGHVVQPSRRSHGQAGLVESRPSNHQPRKLSQVTRQGPSGWLQDVAVQQQVSEHNEN